MSLVKYRIRDVATDFGVAPKEIVEIISKFFEKPKSNTQVLTEEELNVVFDIFCGDGVGYTCIIKLDSVDSSLNLRNHVEIGKVF